MSPTALLICIWYRVGILAFVRCQTGEGLIDVSNASLVATSGVINPPIGWNITSYVDTETLSANSTDVRTAPPGVYIDALRTEFPGCPLDCEEAWPGDGWCDKECATELCGNDGGDCEGWCASDCKPVWLGDGHCDIDCFTSACAWDQGDCPQYKNETLIFPKNEFDYSKCPCNATLLNNDNCNDECNIPTCNWDSLECQHQCGSECASMWLGDGECDKGCNVEVCGFDKGDCVLCAPGCEGWKKGNGVCDKSCDVEECDWDVGDCQGLCFVEPVDYDARPFFYNHCRKEWIGDGHCDCFCYNEDCKYDLGDCERFVRQNLTICETIPSTTTAAVVLSTSTAVVVPSTTTATTVPSTTTATAVPSTTTATAVPSAATTVALTPQTELQLALIEQRGFRRGG